MQDLATANGPPRGGARMSDPNDKRARTFQCRESLWQSLEQMSADLECSIDYLINESLKHYIRQRGGRTSGVIRPSGSTAVISTTRTPAPEADSEPRCWMCQSFVQPSTAL